MKKAMYHIMSSSIIPMGTYHAECESLFITISGMKHFNGRIYQWIIFCILPMGTYHTESESHFITFPGMKYFYS